MLVYLTDGIHNQARTQGMLALFQSRAFSVSPSTNAAYVDWIASLDKSVSSSVSCFCPHAPDPSNNTSVI
jgi:hypothetical protein